jgi:hypothetical protein
MGMFDYIRCEAPLPVPGFDGREFQTKDTPAQYCERYCIRADGTLWYEDCDYEDRSDPNAEGLAALFGSMTPVNPRWEQVTDFTGEICFYGFKSERTGGRGRDCGGWIEFSAYFIDGRMQSLVCTANRDDPTAPDIGLISQQFTEHG